MGLSRTEVISAMLSIDNTEENNYKSEGPHVKNVSGPKRVYGGYVVAQAYKAVKEYARKIKDENPIFSMHYNFLSSGDVDKFINVKVNKMGNIYAVDLIQDGKTIGLAHVKTDHKLMESPSYPSDVPPLLSIPDLSTYISLIPAEKERNHLQLIKDRLIYELRPVNMTSNAPGEHRIDYYARLAPESIAHLKEDSGLGAVVGLSDFFVMQSATNVHKESGYRIALASSMHHRIQFHQEHVEASQWFLVESRTEIANLNKSKIHGAIFDSNKNCIVSFVQEAYMVSEKLDSKI